MKKIQQSRRQFLQQTTMLSIATGVIGSIPLSANSSLAANVAKQSTVGSQLYGWGQYYERDAKKLSDHLNEALSAIRDAGYDYAEASVDFNPENNIRLGEQMRAKGLKPVSLYTGGRLHDQQSSHQTVEKILAAAKACKEAGFTIINCNPDPINREKTDSELETQVQALKELGKGLQVLGMKFGIHHHTPEMKNEAREFHFNFRHSDPAIVGFCFDVHWIYRGGMPPMQALKDYSNRVVSWHLRQSRDGIWWEDLDKGDIDYAEISRFARERNLPPYYTVELALEPGTKITRSVVENHKRSRDFIREVFRT